MTDDGGRTGRPPLLLVGAGVRRLADAPDAGADAVLLGGDRIAWFGEAGDAPSRLGGVAVQRVELEGWITPAFVDAHVHGTATGLAADGLDLSGARSLAEALDLLRAYALCTPRDPVLGTGWDDGLWPEGRPPTGAELRDAAPGRVVLLERVDAHSLVVDPDTLAAVELDGLPEVVRDAHGRPTGWVKEGAAQAVRGHVNARVPAERLTAARLSTCARAAALGIASVHEMGHPGLSSLDDAVAWATGEWPLDVQVWWAELDADAGPRHGLRIGGDLFLDGSIGSHTAAVSAPYRDAGGHGVLFHDDAAVAEFFSTVTARGQQAAVHVIGDRAIEQGIAAVEYAARVHGTAAVRRCRHRFEHVELPADGHIERMAALGVVASMQPAFDAAWGGDDQLYATRFGVQAALASNPVGLFAAAGIPLAFGSDSTVTPLDPWGGVRAAEHHLGGHGMARRAAWAAYTLGGRYAAGQDDVGALEIGARADLAVWDGDPLAVEDPRRLSCVRTFVGGRQVHPK